VRQIITQHHLPLSVFITQQLIVLRLHDADAKANWNLAASLYKSINVSST